MDVRLNTLLKGIVELEVALTGEELQPYLDETAEVLSFRSPLAGFRPGKAPLALVRERFGEERIAEEGTPRAVVATYTKVVKERALLPLGEPQVEILPSPGTGLHYKARVPLYPTVELPDYSQLSVSAKSVAVDQKEIDILLAQLRASRATEERVERGATRGDRILFDYQLFQDRVPLEGSTKGAQTILGEELLVPGLEEELVGLRQGEEKEFRIRFPQAHKEKHFAGKVADVRAKVQEVRARTLPPLDETFAQSLGAGFKTIDELARALRKNLEEEKRTREEERQEGELLQGIVSRARFSDLPEILIAAEIEKMFMELSSSIAQEGLQFDQYLQMIKKSRVDIEREFRPTAERRVKASLVLRAIAEKEEIGPTDEEVQAELKRVGAGGSDHKGHSLEEHRPAIRRMLANRKVLAFLRERTV